MSPRISKNAVSSKPFRATANVRNSSLNRPAANPVRPQRTTGHSPVDRFETRSRALAQQSLRLDAGSRPQAARTFDHREREPAASDGFIVGANGQAHPPGTSPGEVNAVRPSSGPGDETVIFVNGQGTNPASFGDNLQQIANATGANVVGVYNATAGLPLDTLQSLGDKLNLSNNRATETTANLIYDQITQGNDVRLLGHSQGGLIISEAIEDVSNRLRADGRSAQEVERLLGQITVETLGAAATTYPDGPNYTHYINQADFVPRELGLGETNPPLFDHTPNQLGVDTHPGEGATVIQFEDGSLWDRFLPGGNDHSLGTYLEHYARPEDVSSHPDRVEVPNPNIVETVIRETAQAVTAPVRGAVDLIRGIGGVLG